MTFEKPRRPSALRYALNAQEYELFHYYLIQRVHRGPGRRSTEGEAGRKPAIAHDDYHAATVRSSLRVLIGTAAGLKAWDSISAALLSRGTAQR
jgi:hypothetical protein